jgi:hypothetical protein
MHMEQVSNRPMLNAVVVEASKMTTEKRRARILRCVADGRHNPDQLPFCVEPSTQELVRYCDQCWSVIDPHGLTWSWVPQ